MSGLTEVVGWGDFRKRSCSEFESVAMEQRSIDDVIGEELER